MLGLYAADILAMEIDRWLIDQIIVLLKSIERSQLLLSNIQVYHKITIDLLTLQ